MAGYLQGLLSELLPTWMRRKAPATDARQSLSPAVERGTEPPLVGARASRPAPPVADIRRIE